jgi:hypothetical protein
MNEGDKTCLGKTKIIVVLQKAERERERDSFSSKTLHTSFN